VSAPAWIAVGLLGGLAAGARFALDFEISARSRGAFPLGILAVNLAGALALGIVAGAGIGGELRVVAAGGAIGSFTTFSTWMLDIHRLERDGQRDLALLNVGVSIVAGFAAVALGHWLGSL
jgi:fluoride exporter